MSRAVRLTVELTPAQAAGLARFVNKTGFSEAMAVLYPHVDKEIRANQVTDILGALGRLEKALEDVPAWPWIDTGRP